jgi:RimJ/RimL family protein N-acetyltransferase
MEDVTLRPIRESDLDQLSRFSTDPEMASEFEWTGFKDPNAARRRWEQDGWLAQAGDDIALAVDHNGSFAGMVNWRDRSHPPGGGHWFEIGIVLWPDHRGQGVGTAAQRQLVRYLFDHTPAQRLEARTEVTNTAEQHALEKVGFQREGVIRRTHFRAGQWRDGFIYGLLREEAPTDPATTS